MAEFGTAIRKGGAGLLCDVSLGVVGPRLLGVRV